jgi:hypothetical protein
LSGAKSAADLAAHPGFRCAQPGLRGACSQPADVPEFLHALALHLGAVDVAVAIDADEVDVVELAELVADAAPGTDEFAVGAIDGVELAVRIVDDEQQAEPGLSGDRMSFFPE